MSRTVSLSALSAAFVLSLAGSAFAQESQESLKKRLDAKLAEEWVSEGGWVTDYDKARQEAKKSGKPLVKVWKAGKEPRDEESVQVFFILMLEHAEGAKGAALFERALNTLKDRFGSNPQAEGFFRRQDAPIEALREGGGDD